MKNNPSQKTAAAGRKGNAAKAKQKSGASAAAAEPVLDNEIPEYAYMQDCPETVKDILGPVSFKRSVFELYFLGFRPRHIVAWLQDEYGAFVSLDEIKDLTAHIAGEMEEWRSRKLESLYAFVLLESVTEKIIPKDGPEQEQIMHVLLAVDAEGYKRVLGIEPAPAAGRDGWTGIFRRLKERGLEDILFFASENSAGLTDALKELYPKTRVLPYVAHLLGKSAPLVPVKHRSAFKTSCRSLYLADGPDTAQKAFAALKAEWEERCPEAFKIWADNFPELKDFARYPGAIKEVVSAVNPTEKLQKDLRGPLKKKMVVLESKAEFLEAVYLRLNYVKWDGIQIAHDLLMMQALKELEVTRERMETYLEDLKKRREAWYEERRRRLGWPF